MINASTFGRINPLPWLYEWSIGNPIIFRELIRSLRKGRYFVLMAMILIVGTVILATLWTLPDNETQPVGRTLFYATVGGQLLVIILLLPGYVSQNLIVERDRDTFPLLLTTPLSPFRIVYGKLASTLGVMLVLITSTYPLIGVCMARGGVSPAEVIGCAAGLLFASFVVASFAIYHALHATTSLRAIMLTQASLLICYVIGGAVIAFVIGITMTMLFMVASVTNISTIDVQNATQMISVIIAVPLLSVIPISLLHFAAKRLRFSEARIRQSWEMQETAPTFQLSQDVTSPDPKAIEDTGIGDTENPFYWRERKGQLANITPMSIPSWYIIAILAYHLLLITPLYEGRWLVIVTLVFLAQMVPAHAASLFAGERENESWDLLITTICRADIMLWGKIKGALVPSLIRWMALFFTPLIIIYVLFVFFFMITQRSVVPIVPPHFLILNLAVMLTHIGFLIVLTTYLSLRFTEVNRVLVWTYAIAGGYYFAPLVLQLVGVRFGLAELEIAFRALSPLTLTYFIAEDFSTYWSLTLIHCALFLTLTVALYRLSLSTLKGLR